jgi:uncharacterized membrane protein YcaP (DUF421 family)
MAEWFAIDWRELFMPGAVLEMTIRGSVVYIALFLILRFIPNRQIGAVGLTDILVVVLLANAVQNAIADDYSSIADGMILIGTIAFWSYAFNWLGYRFPRFQHLLRPDPLPLIKNGHQLEDNMRRQLLTAEELTSHLRLQGIDHVEDVKVAQMEADGRISVVPFDKEKASPSEAEHPLQNS